VIQRTVVCAINKC